MATTTNTIINADNEQTIETEKPPGSVTLELGDIIEIIAPSNAEIHEISAFITYIDQHKIKLLNVSTAKFHQLNVTENGQFTDESITQINLLSRSEEPGFARQNNLLPKTWVDIHFGGEIPVVITGEITNLEEDMIEITTFPGLNVIYINFGYKGVPENIPIENIIIRKKPASIGPVGSLSLLRQQLEEGEEYEIPDTELASMEYTETGESIIHIPEGAKPDVNIREALHDLYIDANSIVFGERLEAITQLVEVPESQQRYGLEAQVNDLMDELLSTIPNSQRTKLVLDNIHLLIERFKELRSQFSKFDANENIYDVKTVGPFYKPIIEHIHRIDTNLRWLVPVVSNRRKIYDADISAEASDVILEKMGTGLRNIESMQDEYYKKNSKNQTLNYSTMQNRIQEWWNPTDSKIDAVNACLTTGKVLTDLDTIVENLEDFHSSVFSISNGIAKRQFVIQRYNLGLSQLDEQVMKSGKTVYARSSMTPNDTINIKSVIMMPSSVMRFSTIDMPSTNILEKSTLHQNYFMLYRLLRKNVEIIPHIIDDLSKELDYEQMENETKTEFLQGIHEYILDKDMNYIDDNEKFKKFLEVIIPKTRFLIRLVRKYVKNNISFVDVVQQLEPFMVYTKDITYAQHNEIRFFIKERIKEFKQTFAQRSQDFAILRNTNYNVKPKINPILRLLSEKEKFPDTFFQTYNFLSKDKMDSQLSAQEIIVRMIQMDNGNLYTNVLTSIMISLMTPNNLMDALAEPNLDDITDLEQIKPTDCTRRYLSKKYESLKALQKDNNVDELYYDKDMDDTPYDILKKYKEQQKTYLPDLFMEFLIENLVHNHDCPKNIASDLAKTLIANKKEIKDGDYAVLMLKPHLPEGVDESKLSDKEKESIELEADLRKKIQYYRRLNNNWVKDNDIEDESFLDTNTIFCNVSANCYKNSANNICESTDDAASRMKAIARKKMVNEFDKRYIINVEDLENALEKNIEYYLKILKKTQVLNEVKMYKANNLAFELGNLATINDLITSPYIKLRDLIMGQDDFSKKQNDICRFVENYCREPMVTELEESQFWKYCKETNTKLFPASIYELAETFISGEDYVRKLDALCHSVGIMSDDGDSTVDKHSGYVLRKNDFNSEEGIDQSGIVITINDILEKDAGTAVAAEPSKKHEKRVFENETSETIYNVFSAICSNIDIPMEGIDDFVLRTSNELIDKNIMSEKSYQKQSDANFKKTGQYLKTTYPNYRNETIIVIIACTILIAIQTATPSFKTKRTFPGCVRSFSGYPMDGIEDLTGVQYMACVLNKTKSTISPWDSIKKHKPDILARNMKNVIENNIMKRSDITEMFVRKREYNLLNPGLIAPEEHSISKWMHFLPPVVEFSILNKIRNVSSDFKHEFMELMRKGSSSQRESIYVFKSKIVQYGYAIIESINDIVKTKDLLLKTSARIPFLENACCNDTLNATNPLFYFNEENNAISTYIHAAADLAIMLKDVRQLSTASMLYHPVFTGIRYPSVPMGQLEENIYAAIFWYCNFDRNLPVPEDLKAICNEKPSNYDSAWTIQAKMEFVKKNGKRYGVEELNQLMTLVHRKNIVNITSPIPFTQVDVLKEIIEKLDAANSTIIAEPLREHLRNVLDKYEPKQMKDVPSKELDNLTNYLITANTELYRNMMQFFDKYGNLSRAEYNNLHNLLSNIQRWNLDRTMSETKSYFDEGLYAVTLFIQNAIQNFAKIYPTILENDAEFFKKIPKHWGLSSAHEGDIAKFIEKYYAKIEKFKGDNVLMLLLKCVGNNLIDLNLFAQNIPIHTEMVKEIIDEKDGTKQIQTFHSIFDKSTTYHLFVHCFYSCIYEYILCSNEPELLRADVQSLKNDRRTKIRSNADKSNDIHGQMNELNEKQVEKENEIQEVQVVTGNSEELKTRACSLLLSFLNVEEENKSAVDFSYAQIMQRVGRSKEKEKQGIIKYLGDMSIEERNVENDFKNYRLGRWNVGQQKGLVQYDPDTYNREREDLMRQLLEDETTGTTDVVTGMVLDVYELEKDEEDEQNRQDEEEEFGIGGLKDDYENDYYGEDADDDDFQED